MGHRPLFSQAVGFIVALHGDVGGDFNPVYDTVRPVKPTEEFTPTVRRRRPGRRSRSSHRASTAVLALGAPNITYSEMVQVAISPEVKSCKALSAAISSAELFVWRRWTGMWAAMAVLLAR